MNRIGVFPARAGMNRFRVFLPLPCTGVPRASGDEPLEQVLHHPPHGVFPARAGMNRSRPSGSAHSSCVPRASGDEPS